MMAIEKISKETIAETERNVAMLDLLSYFLRKKDEEGVPLRKAARRIGEFRMKHGELSDSVVMEANDAVERYNEVSEFEEEAAEERRVREQHEDLFGDSVRREG